MNKRLVGACALALAFAVSACVEDQPAPPGETTPTTEAPPTTVPVDDREGRFVEADGEDVGACDTPETACATINYAIDQADDGETIWVGPGTYAEIVWVTKPLVFKGPNAGIGAGTEPGVRGPEATVKAFKSPGPHHPSADYEFDVTIDGFATDPMGDTSLLTRDTYHSVALFGGDDVKVINNVLRGADTFVPDCGYTCTQMMDGAVGVFSGTYVVENNLVENYRRPLDVLQHSSAKPVVSATFTKNLVRDFSFRAFWIAEFAENGPFGADTVLVDGNQFIGNPAGPRPSAGLLVTGGGLSVTDNVIANVGAGIYEEVCGTHNAADLVNVYTGNAFSNIRTGYHFRAADDCTGRNPNAVFTGNSFEAGRVDADDYQPVAIGATAAVGPIPSLSAPCNYYGSAEGPGVGDNARVTATIDPTPWATAPGAECVSAM